MIWDVIGLYLKNFASKLLLYKAKGLCSFGLLMAVGKCKIKTWRIVICVHVCAWMATRENDRVGGSCRVYSSSYHSFQWMHKANKSLIREWFVGSRRLMCKSSGTLMPTQAHTPSPHTALLTLTLHFRVPMSSLSLSLTSFFPFPL